MLLSKFIKNVLKKLIKGQLLINLEVLKLEQCPKTLRTL